MEQEINAQQLAHGVDLEADAYPMLYNNSSAFMYRFMFRPRVSRPIEYARVSVSPTDQTKEASDHSPKMRNFIAHWNYAWEAAHLRTEMNAAKIPDELAWIHRTPDVNLCLVADDGLRSQYDLYQSLYHLLPASTLKRFGLPLFKRGNWPFTVSDYWADRMLPGDADKRLERAFATHIWPLLSPGSSVNSFSANDPLRLLAHNLDFWLPHVDAVATARMALFPRVEIERQEDALILEDARSHADPDIDINRPLKGGCVWMGEAEAWEATRELVRAADRHGRLRGLIDAIRSHRVEEDFSDRWSYAREDFERKLHATRVRRTKVTFVQLDDTVPVHGPASQVHEDLLWEDFLSVVDVKERRIVVCLRNGLTRVGDISAELGYANHSPVSKALARIRRKAARLLNG